MKLVNTSSWLLALLAAAFLLSPAAAQRPVVAAYYAAGGKAEAASRIQAQGLTHLIYAFAPMCGDHASFSREERGRRSTLCAGRRAYEVILPEDEAHSAELRALRRLKESNPRLKLLVSVGGWGMPLYPEMIRTSASRQAFIDSVAQLLRDHPYLDGIDIDWEYPGGGDNLRKLLGPKERVAEARSFRLVAQELRRSLDRLGSAMRRRFEITAAVAGYPRSVASVDWPGTHPAFDLVFVMTYDFTPEKAFMLRGDYSGGGGLPGHHTNLHASARTEGYGADSMVSNLRKAGLPAAKMVIGVTFYGREWSDVRWAKGEFPARAAKGNFVGTPSFKDLKARDLKREGFVDGYDTHAEAAYLSSRDRFISLDDERSICAKGKWARAQGLAGLFAWEAGHDDGTLMSAMRSAASGRCAGK